MLQLSLLFSLSLPAIAARSVLRLGQLVVHDIHIVIHDFFATLEFWVLLRFTSAAPSAAGTRQCLLLTLLLLFLLLLLRLLLLLSHLLHRFPSVFCEGARVRRPHHQVFLDWTGPVVRIVSDCGAVGSIVILITRTRAIILSLCVCLTLLTVTLSPTQMVRIRLVLPCSKVRVRLHHPQYFSNAFTNDRLRTRCARFDQIPRTRSDTVSPARRCRLSP